MANTRTPEEILALREAMLARQQARAAGEDVPPPGTPLLAEGDAEEAPPPVAEPEPAAAAEPEPVAQPEAQMATSAQAETPATEEAVDLAARPKGYKRSSEEVLALREAMLARKQAREAGERVPPHGTPLTETATEAASAPQAQPTPAKTAPVKAAPPKAASAQKTATPVKKAATPKPKPTRKKKEPAAPEPPKPVTRREFLNWAWLGAMTLLTAETLGISVLFLYPNFKVGEFGGIFPAGIVEEVVPEKNSTPIAYNDGKFWLTNTDNGIYAIYKICTHLGCLYNWIETTNRFECPCHGSKFELTGEFIEGPAPTSLHRFPILAVDPDDGTTLATSPEDGSGWPLDNIPDGSRLMVDTGKRIQLTTKSIPDKG